MTPEQLRVISIAIEAVNDGSTAGVIAYNSLGALVAEVERLTARVAELEAANADMYRTMEDACKRAERETRAAQNLLRAYF